MIKIETIYIFVSLAVEYWWKLYQMDVKNVFLYGYLKKFLYNNLWVIIMGFLAPGLAS